MAASTEPAEFISGARLDIAKMPGHWVLARMGKRVLRPGGLELTRRMLDNLAIGSNDRVVEFAPGLGVTARMALAHAPTAYTAIERDETAAAHMRSLLTNPSHRCLIGTAEQTRLDDAAATVVYGEAMLTMHAAAQKSRIVREAYRVLQPGGRYGIHELSLVPDELDDAFKDSVMRDLSAAIRVEARPLTTSEWRAALEAEGFEVVSTAHAPMHLLEPKRIIQDEGFGRAIRILFNVLRTPPARKRILAMRSIFRKYRAHLGAITLVARKPIGATL